MRSGIIDHLAAVLLGFERLRTIAVRRRHEQVDAQRDANQLDRRGRLRVCFIGVDDDGLRGGRADPKQKRARQEDAKHGDALSVACTITAKGSNSRNKSSKLFRKPLAPRASNHMVSTAETIHSRAPTKSVSMACGASSSTR